MPAVIASGVVALALLWLALAQYELAVFLGFLVLGIVRFEPGLPDVVFSVVMVVAAATGRYRGRLPLLVSALLAVLLGLNLVSFIDAIDVSRAARYFLITAYLVAFAVWLTGYATSHARVRRIMLAYCGGAVTMAAAASAAVLLALPGAQFLVYEGGQRAQGLLKDPNVFGPFLVLPLLVLIEELVRPRILRSRPPVKLVGIAVLSLGILVSFSRAAWLNAAVAGLVMLGVFALRRRGSRRVVVLALVAVVLVTLLGGAIAVTGSADFLEQRARFQQYDAERFGAQREGLALVAQYPLGVGPGQFEVVSPVAAHSLFVRVFAEQGALGFLVILLLVTLTLGHALVNVQRGIDTFGVGSAALLAAWCGILANSLFIDTLHWRHLWLVAALIWIGSRSRPLRSRE
ncbi:MAG TPA: O-antigen ligase family protein [Gaiellaceae bacterium]|nr:O-antigen ligase family protein [Gaiellaceae bacterium]